MGHKYTIEQYQLQSPLRGLKDAWVEVAWEDGWVRTMAKFIDLMKEGRPIRVTWRG